MIVRTTLSILIEVVWQAETYTVNAGSVWVSADVPIGQTTRLIDGNSYN